MTPSSNSVALLKAATAPLSIEDAPIPTPAADEILIENKALSINPIDVLVAKTGLFVQKFPVILGTDSAGVVVSVGADAGSVFKVGDRVLAFTEGILSPNQDKGGFQKLSNARAITASKIPDTLSFADASTFPLGALTAAVSLFHKDNLNLELPPVPRSTEKGQTVLIWGGASSVGANAIQLAVAAGYTVVATASEKNFELVQSLGATKVVDYRNPTIVEDAVAALSGANFVGTFLAAAAGDSFKQAAEITKTVNGAAHIASAPVYPEGFNPDVKFSWTDLSVRDYTPEVTRIAKCIFGTYLPEALNAGAIQASPAPRVIGKGLEKLQEGVDILAAGVSAEKLVVEL